jgi:hypothetical protein
MHLLQAIPHIEDAMGGTRRPQHIRVQAEHHGAGSDDAEEAFQADGAQRIDRTLA